VKTTKSGGGSKLPGNMAVPGGSERNSERLDPDAKQDDDHDKDDNGTTQNILQPGTKISINDF